MIYHCIPELNLNGGGIYTYVMSLLKHRPPNVGEQAIFNLRNVNQYHFDLLHIHDPKMLRDLNGDCPAIFTLHNHSTYCPSGTKYLKLTHTCCDRKMSFLGCTWGNVVNGCGSRRPQRILQGLKNSSDELLKHLNGNKLYPYRLPDAQSQELIENYGLLWPPHRIEAVYP